MSWWRWGIGGWLLASACAPATPPPRAPASSPDPAPPEPAPAPTVTSEVAPPPTPAIEQPEPEPEPGPTCPEEMALVHRPQGAYCVDRWEGSIEEIKPGGERTLWAGNRKVDGMEARIVAVSLRGRKPQGYISGKQAARACARAGKRLCEIDEWVRACRGPDLTLYPYGNERQPGQCNDRFKVLDHHPVVRLFNKVAPPGTDRVQMWHPSWMNDPRLHEFDHTVTETGAFASCTNEYGVYDMVGNLHEWVRDSDGTFFGGFFMDTFQNGEGCEYRTVGHPFDYHDYSTGFRCCADPA